MPKTSPILNSTVRRFLSTPRLARLSTIGADGYPHIVPMYFVREGDDLVFGTDPGEAKVRNALRHRKAAAVIGGNPETDAAGYMIQGDLAVETKPNPTSIRRLIRRYEGAKDVEALLAEWLASGAVSLRLRARRVIRVW